jgi:hypothetical protein
VAGRSSNVRTVTLTIGGNDIGFVPVISACLDQTKDCYKSWERKVDTWLAALAGKASAKTSDGRPIHAIATLLVDIHTEAPDARIFLAGYPRPFGTNAKYYSVHKGTRVCYIPSDIKFSKYVRYDDAQWFDQTADTLNGVLANAVAKARSKGVPVTFVSVRAAFTTHGDCDSGSSWLTPYNPLAGVKATLHPTAAGQEAYEKDLLAAGV